MIASGLRAALAGLLLIAAPAARAQLPAPVEQQVEAAVASGSRTGVVLAFLSDDRPAFAAAGMLVAGGDQAVGPDTQFETGSVTKLFVAETLAALDVSGRLRASTPLSRIWPDRSDLAHVTLGALATHTAGLPRQIPAGVLASNDPAGLLDLAAAAPGAGSAPAYSNAGFALLGVALETATGQPLANLVREHVTAPLGLASTGYDISDPARLAHPHVGGLDIVSTRPQTVSMARGAGGLVSTPQDLLRFLHAHMSPPDPATAMRVATTLGDGSRPPFGWQRHETTDRLVYHQGGEADGYQVFVAMDLARQTAVVMATNSSADDGLDRIALHLMDPSVPLPTFGNAPAATQTGLDLVGAYVIAGDPGGNRIEIVALADGLGYLEQAADGTPVRRTRLVERAPGVYEIRGIPALIEASDGAPLRLLAGDTSYELERID